MREGRGAYRIYELEGQTLGFRKIYDWLNKLKQTTAQTEEIHFYLRFKSTKQILYAIRSVIMISLFNNKTEWHSDPEDELFDFGKHCNGVFGFEKWQLSDLGQRRWRCTPSVYQLQPAQLSTSESQLVPRIVLRVMAKEYRMKYTQNTTKKEK